MPASGWGQSHTAAQYGLEKYRALTADDGLPSNTVMEVCMDSDGLLWMGTPRGLVRFDGGIIRIFVSDERNPATISGNVVGELAIDAEGNLWVGTSPGGICRYRKDSGDFERYEIFPEVNSRERITEITQLESGLWVSVDGQGVARLDTETNAFQTFVPPADTSSFRHRQRKIITDFLQDPNDVDLVWMPSLDGLWRFRISTEEWTMFDDVPPGHPVAHPEVRSFRNGAAGPDGRLYLATFRRGIFAFDTQTHTWRANSEKNFNPLHLRENNYQKVVPRDENSMWLVSNTRGIAVLDLVEETIYTIGDCAGTGPSDLCGLYAYDMMIDSRGNTAIATREGVRLYPSAGKMFSKLTIPIASNHLKGRFNMGVVFPLDSMEVLVGGYAGEGLYLANRSNRSINLVKPPPGHRVGERREMVWITDIKPHRDGELLVVGAFDLYTYDVGQKRLRLAETDLHQTPNMGYFSNIHRHTDGLYYLSTRHNGVFVLDSNLRVLNNLVHDPDNPNSPASSSYIFGLDSDPLGRLVIASEKGVTLYDSEHGTFVNSDRETRKDSSTSLRVVYQAKVNPADSSMWLLDNRNGVGILDFPYDMSLGDVRIPGEKEGFSRERAHGIHHLPDGETFVTTGEGLVRFAGMERKFSFPNSLGFPVTGPFSPFVQVSDSVFLVGNREVLTWFNMGEMNVGPNDASLYIASVQVFQNELHPSGIYHNLREITLTYLQNFFSIQVGIVDVFNPDVHTLWYRLRGFEDEWVEAGPDRKAIFTNVPGGDFVFEARVADFNGRSTVTLVSLPITIVPPFWKTWWFVALCVLFAVAMAGSFHRVHIRNVRREERLKMEFDKKLADTELAALRAQINPHFLFNSINGIRHEIMKGRSLEAERYLVKFSKLVRMILENSTRSTVPLNEELEALRLYIDLESLRFDNRYALSLDVAPGIDTEGLRIPPMLIQPYVENAIWHGLRQKKGNGRVEITLAVRGENLVVEVVDDGVGREMAAKIQSKSALKKKSVGTEITGNRLEIIEKNYNIRCSAEIIDLKDRYGAAVGTKVVITLPLLINNEAGHTG